MFDGLCSLILTINIYFFQYYPVESNAQSQPQAAIQQPQQIQPRVEEVPVIDPLQPYWDGKGWIYPQPAPSQIDSAPQQQILQHQQQAQHVPHPSTLPPQQQPRPSEPTWNGYEWVYPQPIPITTSPIEQPSPLNPGQQSVASPQQYQQLQPHPQLQSHQSYTAPPLSLPQSTSTEISSQAYGASPYPVALSDQLSALSIEIPNHATSPAPLPQPQIVPNHFALPPASSVVQPPQPSSIYAAPQIPPGQNYQQGAPGS